MSGDEDESPPESDSAGERADDDASPGDAFDVVEESAGEDEDPFERLDDASRTGDPFENIGDGPADERGSPAAGNSEPAPESNSDASPDAGAQPGVPGETDPNGTETEADSPADDPFGTFGAADGDPFGEGQTAFASAEADDGVWERMDDAQDAEVQEVPGRRYVEVSKHSYCEQCEHFSSPPDVRCTHEGTEILEFTDMETVRVIDCPVVEERQALRDEG